MTVEYEQDDSDEITFKVPDGGWGWVVVMSSFSVMFMIDGMFGTYGLLLPVLMDNLKASPSMTSLAGSLMVGSLLFIAMLACPLIERCGCRIVAISGAIVACLGLLLSSTVSNIWMFLATYGLLAGSGMGLMYLPSIVMVNKYFDRRRGVAQSIMSAGSGIGMMVMSPVMEHLFTEYSWRGALMILAGLFLQLSVPCALFRLPKVMNTHYKTQESLYTNNDDGGNPTNLDVLKINLDRDNSKQFTYDSSTRSHKSNVDKNSHSQDNFNHPYMENFDKTKVFKSSTNSLPRNMFISKLHENRLLSHFLSTHCINNNSNSIISNFHSPFEIDRKSLFSQKDIFYSGSVNRLKHYSYISDIEVRSAGTTERRSTLVYTENTKYDTCSSDGSERSERTYTGNLLFNKHFWVVASSAILTQMAQFIPTMFLGDFGMSLGLSSNDVSWIFSVFGILNTFGRFLPGVIIDNTKISSNTLCSIGMMGCSVCCFCFTACTDYVSLMTVTSCFGFFIAFPCPLQPIMVLESVGMDNLTKGLGVVTVLKGPAAIIGPPFAGALYEWTMNYKTTNIFAGCLCLGTVVILVMYPLYRCVSASKQQNDCDEDLETHGSNISVDNT